MFWKIFGSFSWLAEIKLVIWVFLRMESYAQYNFRSKFIIRNYKILSQNLFFWPLKTMKYPQKMTFLFELSFNRRSSPKSSWGVVYFDKFHDFHDQNFIETRRPCYHDQKSKILVLQIKRFKLVLLVKRSSLNTLIV